MKKVKYIISFSLIALMLSSIVFPISASAASKATTLGELKGELAALKAKKANTENKKQMAKSEINQKNNAINNAYKEIEVSENKIVEAKNDIEQTKTTISDYEQKTKELMKFYQIMNGDNEYLEFITDSANMTELIMRMDAVESIAQYNKDMLKKLEDTISSLEQKQVDLKNYEVQLNKNISTYENRIKELDSSLVALSDISMSIDDEINMTANSIKYYQNLGCKDDQKLETCVNDLNNTGWLRPVSKGVMTSMFGWRNVSGQSSYHSGVDIGVPEGTTVYATAAGTVINLVRKSSCGGNQVYVQCIVNGQKYTVQFAHLLSINVNVGQKVNTQSIIGYSGGKSTATRNGGYDRCTTGAHLHYGVSRGYYTSWSSYVSNLIAPPGFPGKGGSFSSR